MITVNDLPSYLPKPNQETISNINIHVMIFLSNSGLKPIDYLSLDNLSRANLNKATLDYLNV